MSHKTFDWLEKAQEEIYEIIKDMTLEEEIAYWKQLDDIYEEKRRKRLEAEEKSEEPEKAEEQAPKIRHKTFDWLEKAQEEIYEETKDMTVEEVVAYWKQRDEFYAAERRKRLDAEEHEPQRKAS